ncbi:hypothetical protein GR11A_00175 [Vibrio phage vB_VcorM_GR11A]|nr:hypothetical protein GR11A_00175 [Vibrio phage vB_VcorM_GR11A]
MTTPIKLILLDMDGLSCDWVKAILKFYPEFKDIDQFNKHPEKVGLVKQFYLNRPNIFARLEMIPQFEQLFEYLVGTGVELGWLTAIDPNHHNPELVKRNKTQWALENVDWKFGTDTAENMVTVDRSADKSMYAEPGVLLIDDYYKNTDAFSAAGGEALCVGECGEWTAEDVINQVRLMLMN